MSQWSLIYKFPKERSQSGKIPVMYLINNKETDWAYSQSCCGSLHLIQGYYLLTKHRFTVQFYMGMFHLNAVWYFQESQGLFPAYGPEFSSGVLLPFHHSSNRVVQSQEIALNKCNSQDMPTSKWQDANNGCLPFPIVDTLGATEKAISLPINCFSFFLGVARYKTFSLLLCDWYFQWKKVVGCYRNPFLYIMEDVSI